MEAGRAALARARTIAITIGATLALGSLAACGAAAPVRTLDDEPDLARIATTISPRLRETCYLLDTVVRTELRDPTLEFTDGQCEWLETPNTAPAGVVGRPELFIGLVASSDGGTLLEQTTTVLKSERTIPLVGERAIFDPETHTLYVLEHGRLWYLQRFGSGAGGEDLRLLERLASSLGQPRF